MKENWSHPKIIDGLDAESGLPQEHKGESIHNDNEQLCELKHLCSLLWEPRAPLKNWNLAPHSNLAKVCEQPDAPETWNRLNKVLLFQYINPWAT